MENIAAVETKVPDVEKFELFLVMSRLKAVASRELAAIGIDVDNMDAIINPIQVRNSIIRQEFNEARAKGVRAERLYCDLAVKHDIEYGTVQQIVKKQR